MAKGLKVSGRMSVGRFEKEFEDEFGVKCQIKDGGKDIVMNGYKERSKR